MSLVEKSEVARVVKLDKVGLSSLSRPIMDILGISDVNQVYEKFEALKGLDFIDAVLDEFHVHFDYYESELKRIPKEGPFITVSNHPLGGIDGLILITLVSQVRSDYRVMANFLLQKVEPLREHLIPVNPFENKEIGSSYAGLKLAIEHVKAGKALGLFPAGEMSTYHFENRRVVDKEWEAGAIKMIRKLDVPVVPIYFKARNSAFFYLLALLHPALRTARLLSELRHQKNKSIRIRIGRPISRAEQAEYPDLDHYTQFLRQRTYLLRQALAPGKKLFSRQRPVKALPLIQKPGSEALRVEIAGLRKSGYSLLTQKTYEVFFAPPEQLQTVLIELGRLREITFREVGEGSNKPLDLDSYDYHYNHLILWDNETEQIAGAYRLGMGPEIYRQYGIRGFYVSTLFKVDKELYVMFAQSLEMGRAFVVKEHQQRPLPLFLLWKGIAKVLKQNPDLKYVTGCASISNRFSKFSQSLMVEYLLQFFGDPDMARHIHPRKPFRPQLNQGQRKLVFDNTGTDLNKFDKAIENLEPNARFPVLIKKYLKMKGRVVCFNLDPLFNNSLDGFMYIRVEDIAGDTYEVKQKSPT